MVNHSWQKITFFAESVGTWAKQPSQFTPTAWQTFIDRLKPVPFFSATLEVDEALWGSFWQGDVISAGYVVPALELTYLRTASLDETPLGDTPLALLHILNEAVAQFPVGAWHTTIQQHHALCITYEAHSLAINDVLEHYPDYLLIWLVEGTLVSCYFDSAFETPGYLLSPLRPFSKITIQNNSVENLLHHKNHIFDLDDWAQLSKGARLDRIIQRHRFYSQSQNSSDKQGIAQQLDSLDDLL
ncbi:MAG: hypothetical protein AAF629_26060 [Chloroflexota bacterium]